MTLNRSSTFRRIIAALTMTTMTRAGMIFSVPNVERFGGVEPDAWLNPWLTDSLLGLLAPIAAYLALRGKGRSVWAALLIYNALGAYDYANGLLTQWLSPQVGSPSMGVFIFIGVFLCIQLSILVLLFQPQVQHDNFGA